MSMRRSAAHLAVARKPVYGIVDPQTEEHGRKCHREQIEMADEERGKTEGQAEGYDEDGHREERLA